ncbi:hypothetical protein Patl1_34722 [Pistacia atlantica]|uniref:Uncharacterized protein n=1 Tax=Pistacia atlantica TaxID=434234 RepID=A0ACC0ZVQ3_9ROSI|nr:hypothetical protein Patl1_34722 [Pistacia atlantica]
MTSCYQRFIAGPAVSHTTLLESRKPSRTMGREEGERDRRGRKAGMWSYVVEKMKCKDERSRKVEVVVAAAVTVVLGIGNRVLYKLALVPLKHYPFFLAQLATFGCADLEKVWDVKPLVNGKEIMSVLQLKSRWPLIRKKKLMAACPSLCDIEECLAWDEANLLKTLSCYLESCSCSCWPFYAFRFGGEKNIHPTLVRDDFTQAMHDFLPVAMRDISKPSPEGGRSGWDDVGGLNDIRNAIKEVLFLLLLIFLEMQG